MWNKYYKNLGIISCLLGVGLCEIKAGADIAFDASLLQGDVKKILMANGALPTYALITAEVGTKIKKVKEDMDWVDDLMTNIVKALKNKKEMQSELRTLKEKYDRLREAFEKSDKELKCELRGNCGPLVNAVKDFKELQAAVQELKIAINNLLIAIRQFILENQNILITQALYSSKLEAKLAAQHGNEIEATVDQIILIIIIAVEAYNEIAYEERNRGLYTTQSSRSL
ncbi:MAG: hypothetical protein LBJ13_00235 [Puniceicoccales bacterium]|jgi:hypothetical protein|nr:hypothetical protein [Puniceicoccales bacterium]